MPNLSLPDIAKQLASLTDAQALELLSSIEGLTARAAAHKAAMITAEAQRDAWATKVVCGCGEPATVCRYVRWEQAHIRVGIATWQPKPKGGIITSDSDYADAPSNAPDVKKVGGDLWVSCGKNECPWVRIPGGHDDGIAGWE
jgi:hypothetical protein